MSGNSEMTSTRRARARFLSDLNMAPRHNNIRGINSQMPRLGVQVGTGLNADGSLKWNVSQYFNSEAYAQESYYTGPNQPSYISGSGSIGTGTNRLCVAQFIGSRGDWNRVFTISRTRNSSGTATPDGINIIFKSGMYSGQQFVASPAYGGPNPPTSFQRVQCAAPSQGTASYGANLGIFPVYPNVGYCGNHCLDACVYFTTDVGTPGSLIPVPIYGSMRNYLTAGYMTTSNTNDPNQFVNYNAPTTWSLAILWE